MTSLHNVLLQCSTRIDGIWCMVNPPGGKWAFSAKPRQPRVSMFTGSSRAHSARTMISICVCLTKLAQLRYVQLSRADDYFYESYMRRGHRGPKHLVGRPTEADERDLYYRKALGMPLEVFSFSTIIIGDLHRPFCQTEQRNRRPPHAR